MISPRLPVAMSDRSGRRQKQPAGLAAPLCRPMWSGGTCSTLQYMYTAAPIVGIDGGGGGGGVAR